MAVDAQHRSLVISMSIVLSRNHQLAILGALWFLGLGHSPVLASGESEARAMARTELRTVLTLAGDPARGRTLFATCAACHGVDGAGQPDGNAPVIARQHRSVLLKQLVDYRHTLRWDLRMEHVVELKKFESLQDLADVAAYVSELPRVDRVGQGSTQYLREGAWTFVLRCASCHGASGSGADGTLVPRLAAQHYEYLRRQLLDIAEGRRPQLSVTHARLLDDLTQADVDGMADYLSRVVPE